MPADWVLDFRISCVCVCVCVCMCVEFGVSSWGRKIHGTYLRAGTWGKYFELKGKGVRGEWTKWRDQDLIQTCRLCSSHYSKNVCNKHERIYSKHDRYKAVGPCRIVLYSFEGTDHLVEVNGEMLLSEFQNNRMQGCVVDRLRLVQNGAQNNRVRMESD